MNGKKLFAHYDANRHDNDCDICLEAREIMGDYAAELAAGE